MRRARSVNLMADLADINIIKIYNHVASREETMARVVVLGAGISGHTAAQFLRRWLSNKHEVTVISPKASYNWIPSNIWVGVGKMQPEQVEFELSPVYERHSINFEQARALAIYPEGDSASSTPYVTAERTNGNNQQIKVPYDYLINATGPKLNFEKTEGLGPDGHTISVCTSDHAAHASAALNEAVARMQKGEKQKFLIGTGHGQCTCQGAAFEYAVNLEFELRSRNVRDKAELTWISNEYELGDFGMGGMHLKRGGYFTHSKVFTESLFAEREIDWITRSHVNKVEQGRVCYETLEGEERDQEFDVAMLLPPFSGVGLKAFAKNGSDITDNLFQANGFMTVDADYTAKPFEEWDPDDWPLTYQSPFYRNIFAVGIAFAPPHPISRPMKSPKGTPIFPTPPRTGMPSAIIAKNVARSIADMINNESKIPTRRASMARMGAACVASAGASWFRGQAVAMTVFPIVPDFDRYPEFGRDTSKTFGEIGLAGHWIKYILHHMFLYKAKMHPGWNFIPE